jgi:hypothetical protein
MSYVRYQCQKFLVWVNDVILPFGQNQSHGHRHHVRHNCSHKTVDDQYGKEADVGNLKSGQSVNQNVA